uniref:COG4 transport protein middle alpha-helical bundle domain-containing protein n=1 Tax=Timspurckia oligopyrenoides TaxID=708627 RepID=A0A7S0ZJP8_9RHOD
MMGNMLRICIRKETGSIMQWLDEQENEHEKAMDNGEHEAHVVALTAVFESVAGFADECEHAIVGKNEESIEQGLMILYRVLKHVQLECDELSQRIVSGYEAVRDLNRLVSNNSSSTTSFRIESRKLDPLLDEIAIFSQRTSAYFGFLTQRLSHPTLDSHDGTNTEIEELIRSSLLWKSVDRLSKHYVMLESTFMTENVQKAISMDEPPVSLSTTQTRFSSAVDDVFFVLQKCSRRAFSYASSDTLCDIIESICTCINQHLIVFIQYRITETNTFSKPNQSVQQSSSLFAEYDLSAAGSAISSLDSNTISSNAHNSSSSESRFSKASYGFSIAVNNAFMCSEYALKLRVSLERDGLSLCIGTRDRSRVSAALNRLSDISTEFHSLCESAIDTLSKSLLTRISSNALNRLEQLDYVISEERYRRGEFENEDSWVNVLIREIDSKVLNGLDTKFMEIPWDLLVRNVAEWTAKKIESLILPVSLRGRRVNTLGALKFDRDIRTLNGYFSSNARRASIRDVFARLSQIALVLGLDSPSEIYDMWGPNAGVMTWRLTPSEVRRVLSLRVEFTPESIRNMKL